MSKKRKEAAIRWMRRFLDANRTYVIVGSVTAAVTAVVVVAALLLGRNLQTASSDVSGQVGTEISGETESTPETMAVPLEENGHPEVNALIQAFYQAAAEGDMQQLSAMAQGLDEKELIYLEKRSAYIEEYQNLVCYTKPGLEEGSYVVYASYDMKFKDMETLVPGVSPYLVRMGEDGVYYIYEGEVDQEVDAYLTEVSLQDDVVDLYSRVQVRYDEAVAEDQELEAFLDQMTEDLTVQVGEALAEAESVRESESDAQQAGGAGSAAPDKVRAIDVVNVRASDSEQAERIGKLQIGDELNRLESRANGWSMVEYEGKQAFVKTEFLEPIEPEGEASGQSQPGQNGGEGGTDLPASGIVVVDDTVNIRQSPDADSDRIAVCYEGSSLEILSHESNGWTKVRYDGKTGYVRTDVLVIRE